MKGLGKGLQKTRRALLGSISALFKKSSASSDEFWESWKAALISVDIGVKTATDLATRVRERVEREAVKDPDKIHALFEEEMLIILKSDAVPSSPNTDSRPRLTVLVGVNGSGKTTAAAKLARYYQERGEKVILAACDTFRAAAIEQLGIWAGRLGVDMVHQDYGSDAAAVAFDAFAAARSKGRDRLIIDTAGRLHTKANLMGELKKIIRVLKKAAPSVSPEVLLTMDAGVGQNGLVQARSFLEAVGLNGVILNKIDGSAHGGIAVAIQRELGVPVLFVGVGEGVEDLAEFDPLFFTQGLLEGE